MFTLLDLALTDERHVLSKSAFTDETVACDAFDEFVRHAKLYGGRIELRRGTEYGEVIASYSGMAGNE